MNVILVQIGPIKRVEITQSVLWLGNRQIEAPFPGGVIYFPKRPRQIWVQRTSKLMGTKSSFPWSRAVRMWWWPLAPSCGKTTHFRKLKTKFSLDTPIKECGRMEVWIHFFLSLALDGDEWAVTFQTQPFSLYRTSRPIYNSVKCLNKTMPARNTTNHSC